MQMGGSEGVSRGGKRKEAERDIHSRCTGRVALVVVVRLPALQVRLRNVGARRRGRSGSGVLLFVLSANLLLAQLFSTNGAMARGAGHFSWERARKVRDK
jgi:hypothetical protein